MKSTLYRPKKKTRKTKHGFFARTKSRFGRRVINRRRQKGRHQLTV